MIAHYCESRGCPYKPAENQDYCDFHLAVQERELARVHPEDIEPKKEVPMK